MLRKLVIHMKMMELFRLYLIVGGMPATVSKYIETNNLQEVMAVQKDIIALYKRDIAKSAHSPTVAVVVNGSLIKVLMNRTAAPAHGP